MEITPDQKTFLQQVDADIEASFAQGVTQSGPFLPALPLYDRIKPEDRQLGRQGILSSFTGFLGRLLTFTPTRSLLEFQNNFASWNAYIGAFGNPEVYTEFGYYQNLIGEVVLGGMLYAPSSPAYTPFGTLPVGLRPEKTLVLTALLNGTPSPLYINAAGQISLGVITASGQWVSVDELRFRPA